MKRVLAMVAQLLARLVSPFRPEPGTTEGAVSLGLVMVFVAFAIADLWPLSFLVPGLTLVVLGSLPAIVAARRAR